MGDILIEDAEGGKILKATGEFGLVDAVGVHGEMARALGESKSCLTLDLEGVEQADLTFLQLLLSLAAQARLDRKRVALRAPLPLPILQAAESHGVSFSDIKNYFDFEDLK